MGWLWGSLIVLLGWGAGLALLTALGLLPTRVAAPGAGVLRQVRASLWWGLLLLVILGYGASIWLPLASTATATIVVVTALALGIPGWWLLSRQARTGRWALRLEPNLRDRRHWPWLAGGAGLGLAIATLALAALSTVTHYDAGLYQLGAIRYAAEFPAIRGIANLYQPLGYANAEPVLAALAGNGPWGLAGFRLVNGFVMVLLAADLLLRTLSRGHRNSVGWWVLVVGLTATWVPMVAMADFWVTSPTADSAVLMVALACVATLADQVRRPSRADLASVVVLCTLLVLLRPTMVVFAGLTALVALAVAWRRMGRRALRPVLASGLAAVLAAVQLVYRDVLLSGWLQYPLSLLAFDVPWRAADPTTLRVATLGFARNPADIWGSVEGWAWVGPWVSQLPWEWAFWLAVALVIAAAGTLALATRRARGRGSPFDWHGLLVTCTPALAAVAVWWATTPPALRFIWGPLFAVGILPLAWALRELNWRRAPLLGAGAALIAVSGLTLFARIDWSAPAAEQSWLGLPVRVALITQTPTAPRTLASGLVIMQPTTGEHCWAAFPLCSPAVPEGLRPLATDWADGLQP